MAQVLPWVLQTDELGSMLSLAQVKVYLHGKGTDSARRIQIQQSKGTAIIFALADNESCVDVYMGEAHNRPLERCACTPGRSAA